MKIGDKLYYYKAKIDYINNKATFIKKIHTIIDMDEYRLIIDNISFNRFFKSLIYAKWIGGESEIDRLNFSSQYSK